MATIPKYVYQEMKRKVETKLENAKEDVFNHYKKELAEIGNKILLESLKDAEVEKGYSPTRQKQYGGGSYQYRFRGNLKVDVKFDGNKIFEKIEEKQEKVMDKIKKIEGDLDKELETWQLDLFTKASEGTSILMPTFKVDYSKY